MFLSSGLMSYMKIMLWILWTLGLVHFGQPVQPSNQSFHLRRYTSNGSFHHTEPEILKSDTTYGRTDLRLEDRDTVPLQSNRGKRDEENGGDKTTTTAPADKEDDKPNIGLLEFKWISYLLLFAIINLLILLLIGIAFVIYFSTQDKCKEKNKGGNDEGWGCIETEIECSCEE
ncbi:hypothetical protein V9T40_003544 [Parthenolecanium corni]|uniref:Uncharacterized protein n=1 Tax=Parthenolecanium corni TaxID=536013 RepID=A0AAN9YAH3_9HEMI